MERQILTIRNVNKHLENLELECIDNNKINPEHLGHKGLHLNPKGKSRLTLNFLKQLWKFWKSVEHVNESHISSNTENEMDHNNSGKSENTLSDPIIIEENTYDSREINDLRDQNPFGVIIAHVNIILLEISLNHSWVL